MTTIVDYAQGFTLTQSEIESRLNSAKSWEDKYRNLMLLGKELGAYPTDWQLEEFKVQGCESNVWLQHQWLEGKLWLAVGSDAKIVKGLIALVLSIYNGKTAEEISHFEVQQFLSTLGLMAQLSPSRTNGLNAIIEQIRTLAAQH